VAGLSLREVTALVTSGLQPKLGAPEVTVAINEAQAGPESTQLGSAPPLSGAAAGGVGQAAAVRSEGV